MKVLETTKEDRIKSFLQEYCEWGARSVMRQWFDYYNLNPVTMCGTEKVKYDPYLFPHTEDPIVREIWMHKIGERVQFCERNFPNIPKNRQVLIFVWTEFVDLWTDEIRAVYDAEDKRYKEKIAHLDYDLHYGTDEWNDAWAEHTEIIQQLNDKHFGEEEDLNANPPWSPDEIELYKSIIRQFSVNSDIEIDFVWGHWHSTDTHVDVHVDQALDLVKFWYDEYGPGKLILEKQRQVQDLADSTFEMFSTEDIEKEVERIISEKKEEMVKETYREKIEKGDPETVEFKIEDAAANALITIEHQEMFDMIANTPQVNNKNEISDNEHNLK